MWISCAHVINFVFSCESVLCHANCQSKELKEERGETYLFHSRRLGDYESTAGIQSTEKSRHSTNRRKMPTWMCKSQAFARFPSSHNKVSEQERGKRGVTMGCTREYWKSAKTLGKETMISECVAHPKMHFIPQHDFISSSLGIVLHSKSSGWVSWKWLMVEDKEGYFWTIKFNGRRPHLKCKTHESSDWVAFMKRIRRQRRRFKGECWGNWKWGGGLFPFLHLRAVVRLRIH